MCLFVLQFILSFSFSSMSYFIGILFAIFLLFPCCSYYFFITFQPLLFSAFWRHYFSSNSLLTFHRPIYIICNIFSSFLSLFTFLSQVFQRIPAVIPLAATCFLHHLAPPACKHYDTCAFCVQLLFW